MLGVWGRCPVPLPGEPRARAGGRASSRPAPPGVRGCPGPGMAGAAGGACGGRWARCEAGASLPPPLLPPSARCRSRAAAGPPPARPLPHRTVPVPAALRAESPAGASPEERGERASRGSGVPPPTPTSRRSCRWEALCRPAGSRSAAPRTPSGTSTVHRPHPAPDTPRPGTGVAEESPGASRSPGCSFSARYRSDP